MIGIRFVFLKVARFNRCTVEISTRQQIVVRGILNLYVVEIALGIVS